jgi:hypothetical protein
MVTMALDMKASAISAAQSMSRPVEMGVAAIAAIAQSAVPINFIPIR